MGDFYLGETNFGIDDSKSRFELEQAPKGQLLLTIDIRGNTDIYKTVSADESSKWFTTLYPPQFYLRQYPIQTKGKERSLKLKPEDSDNFDVALYMMEHNDVEDVTIKLSKSRIEVSGQVDFMGESMGFRILWDKHL